MTPWLIVSALSVLALCLRVLPRYAQVFGTPGFVNFVESDAWWHVRMMDHMARHFPHRLTLDPLGRIDGGQTVDTGLFFDAPIALVGWALQLSSPALEHVAAWYPALLGMLLVPVTFLCGRAIFHTAAGLWAAAIVATLPGHFLHTGSLGFTDHHVMETLLTGILLYLLAAEASAWALGVVLAAYLLTFSGGAFVIVLVAAWYWLEALRDSPVNPRPFALACLFAVPFAFWQVQVYLMRYSLLALLLAAAGLWLLPNFSRWCRRQGSPRAVYIGLTVAAIVIALSAASWALPGPESLFAVIGRLTAAGNLAPTVGELQSLTGVKGFFSLEYPWREFGGAFIFTLIALPLLAETTWRRPNPRHTLLVLWAALFFLMAMTQARMAYYYGLSAALLSGYLMSQLPVRSLPALALGAFLILPNLQQAATDTGAFPGQVSPAWREALSYLRERTPEPFPNGPGQPPTYSVLAWWDFGYWITTIAHRVPVTNPTQNNAAVAADFYLATNDATARAALVQARARYVISDSLLPLLGDELAFHGAFLNLFAYARGTRPADYLIDTQELDEEQKMRRRLFFRPTYFRSMVVRLYLANGQPRPAPAQGSFAVIEMRGNQLVNKRTFTSLAEAQAAATTCPRCELVSENPMTPCVDLEAVNVVEPIFTSTVRKRGELPLVKVFAVR